MSLTRRVFPILAAATLFLAPLASRADVKLPALFSDHMVLQRDMPVPVWGWATPEEEVKVTFAGQTKTMKADRTGKWSVKLDRLTAGGPHEMTVQGENKLTIKDVLVGEVWLASGQSNMAMTVQRCSDFEKEKAVADLPRIRMFTVTSGPATKPQTDCAGKWAVCSPDSVGAFSGTAFFFGRELHKQLDVPIGLINSSVGGTAIEAWTSHEAQKDAKELTPIFERWKKADEGYDPEKAKEQYEKALATWMIAVKKAKDDGKPAPRRPQAPVQPSEDRNHPANLFNGKIAPLRSH